MPGCSLFKFRVTTIHKRQWNLGPFDTINVEIILRKRSKTKHNGLLLSPSRLHISQYGGLTMRL